MLAAFCYKHVNLRLIIGELAQGFMSDCPRLAWWVLIVMPHAEGLCLLDGGRLTCVIYNVRLSSIKLKMSSLSCKRVRLLGRSVVVFLGVLALTVSLASRTADLNISAHQSVQSQTQKAKVQHRDRDAHGWSPVVTDSDPFYLAVCAKTLVPENTQVISEQLDSCLYNRPPPRS
jgi:hypothetical protein